MEEGNHILKVTYQKALLPNILMTLGGTIPVFTDSLLIGRKFGVGGMAAVNQCFAAHLLLCTFGSCVAAGAMAEASHFLGRNRTADANRIYCISIEWVLLMGVLITVIGSWLSHSMAVFWSSPDTTVFVERYLKIVFASSLWKLLLYVPVYFLRLQGRIKRMAGMTFFMALLHIVLDYVFLYVLDLGMEGAAYASMIATASAVLLGFCFLMGRGSGFYFHPVRLDGKTLWKVMQNGSPVAANNFLAAVRLILLGSIMKQAGGSALVAVFAITNNVNECLACIQVGIPQTGMTMLGILAGEKDVGAIRMIQKMQMKYGIWYSMGLAGIIAVFSRQIGGIFGNPSNVRLALLLFALGIVPATVNSVMSYFYFALKRTRQAVGLIFLRVLFFAVSFAWLLSDCGDGIFLFYLLSELATTFCWLLTDWWLYQHHSGGSLFYLLNEGSIKNGRSISFTVSCDPKSICNAASRIGEFCRDYGFTSGQLNGISLALEEILVIISEKSLNWQGTIDVRVLSEGEGGILRFRSAGKYYNPLELADTDSLDYLGIRMITGLAERIEYQSTLGLNTLLVVIEKRDL